MTDDLDFDEITLNHVLKFICLVTCTVGLILGICGCSPAIVGIVFFCLSDTRQELINKFNGDVDYWNDNILPEMKKFAASVKYENTTMQLVKSENSFIDLSKIRSEYDSPAIKSWDAYYLSYSYDLQNVKYFDDPEFYDFTYSSKKNTKFFLTYVLENRAMKYTNTYHTDKKTHHRYISVSAHTKCMGAKGYWRDASYYNCYWYYQLKRFCILMDPQTGDFESLDGKSNGCNYLQKNSNMVMKNTPPIITKKPVRSKHDPEVLFSVLTKGSGDFGMTFHTKQLVAIICSSVGGSCVLCCCAGIIMMCLSWCVEVWAILRFSCCEMVPLLAPIFRSHSNYNNNHNSYEKIGSSPLIAGNGNMYTHSVVKEKEKEKESLLEQDQQQQQQQQQQQKMNENEEEKKVENATVISPIASYQNPENQFSVSQNQDSIEEINDSFQQKEYDPNNNNDYNPGYY